MKKTFFKSLVISFAFWQAVFTTALPLTVFAQEAEATPTPIPESTSITTGDATSEATAQGSANTSETDVPGSLTGEGCGGPEMACPTDTTVSTDQEATTDTSSSGTSETGENEATTSGDLLIDTGDADSQATTDSTANVSVISLTNEEFPSSPAPSPATEATLDIDTTQEATASVFSSAISETGENMGLTEERLQIITGAAFAIATSLNITNINLVGSDLIWLITTILGSEEGNINFYDLFANLPQPANGEVPVDATITTNQTSVLQSETQAGADSGDNSGEGQSVEMETGEATAIANTVNLTNLNLVGSRGLFTVINIVGSLLGDIILPNGSHLLPSNFPWGNTQVITNQEADINSSSTSDGNTGENEFEGSGDLSTGDTTAVANTQSFANLVRIGDGWAFLIFNLFGSWNGSLVNWDPPGSERSLEYGTSVLEQEWDVPQPGNNNSEGSLTVITNQNATVHSTTTAGSNTGMNNLKGLGRLSTGNAFSLANDFTLANFVGVGGSLMFGIFNVIGNWVGNLVVAYPDLEVSVTDGVDTITPGSLDEFMVTVTNRGDARANAVSLGLSFSGEFTPSGSSSWDIGPLGPGESKTYKAQGTVASTALANTTIGATTLVSTQDTEESSSNNSATDSTLVVIPPPQASEESGKDTRLPDLKINVWNNVNGFVYPGDTVLASITVANQSPFPARGVFVTGSLSNDHPMPPIPMNWKIGDLKPGERVRIEFEIGLIEELPGGAYHLSAEAKGKSEAGDESGSGVVTSDFWVRLKDLVEFLTPTALAGEEVPSSGQILGAASEALPIDKEKYLPYILAITVFAYFGILALRRKIDGKPILPAFLKKK